MIPVKTYCEVPLYMFNALMRKCSEGIEDTDLYNEMFSLYERLEHYDHTAFQIDGSLMNDIDPNDYANWTYHFTYIDWFFSSMIETLILDGVLPECDTYFISGEE